MAAQAHAFSAFSRRLASWAARGEEELEAYHQRYAELAAYAREKLKKGESDVDSPALGKSG
jgi:hypothetical protein